MIFTVTLNPAVDRELNVPAMEFDTVLRAVKAQVDFGGKGFNVSRLLKGLDTPSTAVGFVGGKSGEILRDGLQALGWGVASGAATASLSGTEAGSHDLIKEHLSQVRFELLDPVS